MEEITTEILLKVQKIVAKMQEASNAYYNGEEIMSNFEYDALEKEFDQLNAEYGLNIQKPVGAKVSELKKVKHEFPALSLDKTKDISEFPKVFFGEDHGGAVVMYKEDGSTVVATYEGGKLIQLATRGNGEVGQDITHNAPYIKGLPMMIPYTGKLIVRGEAVMSYGEFDRLNGNLPEEDRYSNPRNLANATISMLDSNEMKKREIWLQTFTMVYKSDEMPFSFVARFHQLEMYGFHMVPYRPVLSKEQLLDQIQKFTEESGAYEFPVDGLVVASEDAEYAGKQPGTEHNPNKLVGYALKWKDECAETTLRNIEWSASRTGLLNPVAVFDPVDLEGTTVTRSTVSNLSQVERLHLHIGDKISVYKANKIIPAIAENLTPDNGDMDYAPKFCPVCGCSADVSAVKRLNTIVKTVWCKNPNCAAKHIGRFVHFVERDCMNIDGLSEATIAKLVDAGYLKSLPDFYKLGQYAETMSAWDGFGKKSVDNMLGAIEKSRKTDFVSFVHSLGIPNIGKGQAKLLNKVYMGDVIQLFTDIHDRRDFTHIEGIGEVLQDSLYKWGNEFLAWIPFADDVSRISNVSLEIFDLLKEVKFEQITQTPAGGSLAGKTFVITGSVEHFDNRDAIKAFIETNGGKATDSVTGKTSFLINNDVTSTSGKNKKAKELGVPVISEQALLDMVNG
jgi:DNA ligase (NAD+)